MKKQTCKISNSYNDFLPSNKLSDDASELKYCIAKTKEVFITNDGCIVKI